MNKRLIGILIILIGFIILITIVYFIFFHNFNKSKLSEQQQPTIESTQTESIQPVNPIKNEPIKTIKKTIDTTQTDLKSMAASFAERFGSYSNHSNYSNIIDLEIFMSQQMKKWASDFIKESREKNKYFDIYYGITTKAISQEIKNFNIDTAEVLVKTQKRESTGTMNNASISYQDILISFIKEKGSWKVDKAEWQVSN